MKNNTTPFTLCNKVLRLWGAALLFIALCLLFSCDSGTQEQINPDGSGENVSIPSSDYYDSNTNTYHIYTEQGLKAWAESDNCLSANVKLERDIRLTEPEGANDSNWNGIGDFNNGYNATFDGQNHTISGLKMIKKIYNDIDSRHGFFCRVDSKGTIKNLKLTEVNIDILEGSIGAIAGSSFGTIENCSVSGTRISGFAGAVGGIVGSVQGGSILKCINECNVIGTNQSPTVGGIVGTAEHGSTISICENYGNLTSEGYFEVRCGGIAGRLLNSTVDECISNGNIVAKNTATDKTGSNYTKNTLSLGGIVGHNEGTGSVTNCSIELPEGKITIDASYNSSGLNEGPYIGNIVGQGSEGSGHKGEAEKKVN